MTAVQPITLAEVMPADVTTHADAPLVGVVVPLNYPDLSDETRELVVRFTRTALNTLTDLGARLLIIDPTSDAPASFDDEVDGLVLLGGGDVDPSLYGYVGEVPNLYGVDRRCDLRTLAAINWALDEQIPVFGICRGAQMINLAYGGILIPDLGPDTPHHGHGNDPLFLDDIVTVEPQTRLFDILGRTTLTVRNGHHQAVGDAAPQLRVAARGVDGVIEAIEHCDPETWVLGVQWHPEDTDGPAAEREALFRAFLVRVDIDRRAVRGRVYIDASMRRPANGLT